MTNPTTNPQGAEPGANIAAASEPPPATRTQKVLAALRAAIVPVAAGLWAALGTFWTIFAWYHQEIVVPSTAPVNLTTEITLEAAGSRSQSDGQSNSPTANQLEAIQLSVTANNVSSKDIRLLSNYWDAWIGKVSLQPDASDNAWLREANDNQADQATSGQLRYARDGKYYKIEGFERVAWGNVFPTTYLLYPKETVSASVLFYVPKEGYDLVHVEVHIPTKEKEKNGEKAVDLTFIVDRGRVKPKYFKVDKNGSRQEVTEKEDIQALKIQETQSIKQLSLWPKPTKASKP